MTGLASPPFLALSRRLRTTPFSSSVEKAGAKAYTVYNRMRLPAAFRSMEEDYRHLKSRVQVWDVSCQRQVEIRGKNALWFVQKLTPRWLGKMGEDRCYYTPMVNENGGMLNDPVTLRLDQDRFWISLADSDLLLWIKGLAVGMGTELDIFEPDVSPLAVQGPFAEDLMASVFGEAVKGIGFFRYQRLAFAGKKYVVARSGYSMQGGFEIYVEGSENGEAIWNALFEAGKNLGVRAGCPNLIERIEGGLLSYGNDMTAEDTPFECGLGKFCNETAMLECIGGERLLEESKRPPRKKMMGFRIGGEKIPHLADAQPVFHGEKKSGCLTSAAYSPDLDVNIGLGMIDATLARPDQWISVSIGGEIRKATLQNLPFIQPPTR